MHPLADSLELCAQRSGDPRAQVYARLFAVAPELQDLFVMDRSGSVRQEMLRLAIEALLDLVQGGQSVRGLIATEALNHAHLGVPPARFMLLFEALRDVVRDALGTDWSPATDAAWQQALAQLRGLAQGATAAPA